MSTLVEISEYIDQVLRLDLDTPVKGFDGTEIGPSNEQAQVLANRTKWLKERLTKLSESLEDIKDREYVASINKKTGAITLTYSDVGAAAKDHTHDASEITTTDEKQFVSLEDKNNWNDKQEKLISGTTLKTVLGISLLGSGDITIKSSQITTDETARFVTDDEIQKWNTKQTKLVSGTNISTLHGKTLLSGDDVKLSYSDVGADKSGAGTEAVAAHVSEDDPHTQYLTLARAKENVVFKDTGNQANGYLQLDDKGHIPIEFIELFQAKYVIVDNKAERLAIEKAGDITICLETDTNKTYYLNGLEDPSVESNWKEGQSTEINTVASVFGRVGSIKAQTGDYTADQITETSKRVFVTPDNKTTWDAKQEKLVSGTNIRTVNGESLLGNTDIEITTDSIGAAEKEHTHKPSEITTDADAQFVSEDEKKAWNAKQDNLVSGTNIKTINEKDLVGKGNIDLTYSDVGAAAAEHKHDPSDIKTDDNNSFVSADEKKTWNAKQATLVSGTSIKTLNKESLLGEGDITIDVSSIGAAEKKHQHKPSDIETDTDNQFISQSDRKLWTEKQDKLVSGKTLATVFGQSLLQAADITLSSVEDLAFEINSVLEAGEGVTILFDDDNGKIIFSRDADEVTNTTATIVDVEGAKGGQAYSYKIDQDNFDFITYVLKKVVEADGSTTAIDYTSIGSTLPTAPTVTFDRTGYIPDADGVTKYELTAVTTDYETFSTAEIPTPSEDKTKISLNLGGMKGAILSPMENATGDGFTLGSSLTQSNYEAWKSFQYNDVLTKIPAEDHWRAGENWNGRKLNSSLTITFDEPVYIEKYGFQGFSSFETASASPTQWVVYAREAKDSKEIKVASGYIKTLFNTSGTWVTFDLDIPGTYQVFNIIFTEAEKGQYALALSRFQVFNGGGALIKSAANDYYTVSDSGAVTQVTPSSTMFDSNFGETKTPILLSGIRELFPIKLVSNKRGTGRVSFYKTVDKITLHYPLYQTTIWELLGSITFDEGYNESDKNNLRVAVTVDGSKHYIFKNKSWSSIGTLTNDETSAQALKLKGITFDELSAITNKEWNALLGDNPETKQIGLAYGSVIEKSTDATTPKKLGIVFNPDLRWTKMSEADVEIYIKRDKIIFKPTNDGDYKFCYKFN